MVAKQRFQLYRVEVADPAQGLVNLQVTPGTAPPMRLVENDLVELVTEDIDLGDDQRATVILVDRPRWRPLDVASASFAWLKTTNADDVVQLCDFTTKAPIVLTAVTRHPRERGFASGTASSRAPPHRACTPSKTASTSSSRGRTFELRTTGSSKRGGSGTTLRRPGNSNVTDPSVCSRRSRCFKSARLGRCPSA